MLIDIFDKQIEKIKNMKSLLLLTFTLSSYFVFSQKLFTIPTSVCKNKYIKISTVTAKKNENHKSKGVFLRTDLNFILVDGKKKFEHVDLPYGKTPDSPNEEIYNGEIIYKGISKSKYFYYTITKGWTWVIGRGDENSKYKLLYNIEAIYFGADGYSRYLLFEIPVYEAGEFQGVDGDVIHFFSLDFGDTNLYPQLIEDPNSTHCELDWCVWCIDTVGD